MLQVYRPTTPIQWTWIAIKGPDAADFLHRLTTVHIKAMKPGEGLPGFFLTAQGKMRAYFHLWMLSKEEFFFELDAGVSGKWKPEVLSVIDQFHFGEKLVVENGERPVLACAWLFPKKEELAELRGLSPWHSTQGSGGLRFFHHGSADFGIDWLSVWGDPSSLESWLGTRTSQELSFEQVEKMRISSTRPRMDAELSENTIPLEVGLRDAVSDNKGCYPGQEVIERIISLGAPAKRLSLIEGAGTPPSIGDVVTTAEGGLEVGHVTSVSASRESFLALAFVKKMHAKEGLEVTFPSQPASRAKLTVIAPYA